MAKFRWTDQSTVPESSVTGTSQVPKKRNTFYLLLTVFSLILLVIGFFIFKLTISSSGQAGSPSKDKVVYWDPASDVPPPGLQKGRIGSDCEGAFELIENPGLCTHGPDFSSKEVGPQGESSSKKLVAYKPAQEMDDPETYAEGRSPLPETPWQCYGDGKDGKRVKIIYAYVTGKPDRYDDYRQDFDVMARKMETSLMRSAQRSNGERHWRFETDTNCELIIDKVKLSSDVINTTDINKTVDRTISELKVKGYKNNTRKYVVLLDMFNVYSSSVNGQYVGPIDSNPDPKANDNNTKVGYTITFDRAWDNTEAHELMHSLGSVTSKAEHVTQIQRGFVTNPGKHCYDEWDRMCEDEGKKAPIYVCGEGNEFTFPAPIEDWYYDCNHDDYFHANPPANSRLNRTHKDAYWNTANSSWMESKPGTPPPVTPPNIESIEITQSPGLDNIDVTISWKTDRLADGKVLYGTTTAYGQETYDATEKYDHEFKLSLAPGTTYYYAIESKIVGDRPSSITRREGNFTTTTVTTRYLPPNVSISCQYGVELVEITTTSNTDDKFIDIDDDNDWSNGYWNRGPLINDVTRLFSSTIPSIPNGFVAQADAAQKFTWKLNQTYRIRFYDIANNKLSDEGSFTLQPLSCSEAGAENRAIDIPIKPPGENRFGDCDPSLDPLYGTKHRTLRMGDTDDGNSFNPLDDHHNCVSHLHWYLIDSYGITETPQYSVDKDYDGVFTEDTRTAVVKFQGIFGVSPISGTVGPLTWHQLHGGTKVSQIVVSQNGQPIADQSKLVRGQTYTLQATVIGHCDADGKVKFVLRSTSDSSEKVLENSDGQSEFSIDSEGQSRMTTRIGDSLDLNKYKLIARYNGTKNDSGCPST